MNILHLLKTEQDKTVLEIIEAHKTGNEMKVIDLSKDDIQYEKLVDAIFDCDRVFSW